MILADILCSLTEAIVPLVSTATFQSKPGVLYPVHMRDVHVIAIKGVPRARLLFKVLVRAIAKSRSLSALERGLSRSLNFVTSYRSCSSNSLDAQQASLATANYAEGSSSQHGRVRSSSRPNSPRFPSNRGRGEHSYYHNRKFGRSYSNNREELCSQLCNTPRHIAPNCRKFFKQINAVQSPTRKSWNL